MVGERGHALCDTATNMGGVTEVGVFYFPDGLVVAWALDFSTIKDFASPNVACF